MRAFSLVTVGAVLALLTGISASGVTMDWTPIGNAGNACDPQPANVQAPGGCFGSVGYAYYIGIYEVTNAQYADFLNAKASVSDPLALFSPGGMDFGPEGGISRSGSDGSYTYSAIAGREDMPVVYVSYYQALRFANWMNNGQGNGDTETGAYTLLGGAMEPSNGLTVTRNAGAAIALPSENEWYKAAYYSSVGTSYFDYPTETDTSTLCSAPTASPNSTNCGSAVGNLTVRGSYPSSASPYGTFDQGGNVWEWNEAIISGDGQQLRGVRGGSWFAGPNGLLASARDRDTPIDRSREIGFRLVLIPEPSTGLLVIAGLLGLALNRRGHA